MAKPTVKQLVLKVQRPLMTTDPDPKLIVYSEDRKTVDVLIPIAAAPELFKALGDEPKGYFLTTCHFDGKGDVFLDDMTPILRGEPSW